jgi:hypothetical protein
MTVQGDAIRLVEWLKSDHMDEVVPYMDIAAHFGWMQGGRFHRRLTTARDLAHERKLSITFDVPEFVGDELKHACMLTRLNTLKVAESLPTRLKNVSAQSARIGRAASHIGEFATDPMERLLAEVTEEGTQAMARMMANYGRLIALFVRKPQR